MSTWIYRKPEEPHERGLCILCPNPQKRTSRGTYQALCNTCDKRRYKAKDYTKPYRKVKKRICERCQFKALDRCQLDVHHIDGNHHNNDPNNLETLCANCHRLEHFRQKETPPAFTASGV